MSNVVSANRSGSRRATRRPRSAADFAERLQGRGRYGFSLRELAEATGLSHAAAGAQLKRLLPRIVPLYQKRSEEHTSELQSLMRISYAVFCLIQNKI